MPGSVARPSTANTMCLVLKPKTEVYNTTTPIIGSESEREAWRKNRVIQMKLGAYLAEVQQQQHSCARLLKTEEYRFMQEATRRSSVPRSVEMLQQLHFYREQHFPRTRYTYGTSPPRDAYHHHYHGIHKHPPLSARLIRSHKQPNGLSRPKTSATIYRKLIDNMDPQNNIADGDSVVFDDKFVYNKREADRAEEHIFDLVDSQQQTKFQQPLRHTTELPAINVRDNFENIFPQDAFVGRASTPKRPIQNIDANRKILNDTKAITLPKTPFASKQRTESISTSISKCPPSIKNLNSVSKFSSSDLPLQQQQQQQQQQQGKGLELDRESIKSIHADTEIALVNDQYQVFIENEVEARDIKSQFENDEYDTTILAGNAFTCNPAINDIKLDILDDDDLIDYEINDGPDHDLIAPQEKPEIKKPLKSLPKRTSFNRIRTEPVMPLRHNITSVLRQERARYEANQLKVKNYIHKMSSRDTISRPNPREQSATSRKSSAGLNDSRTDSKVIKKNNLI